MKSGKSFAIVSLALVLAGTGALAWKQYEELVALRAQLLEGDSTALKKQLADARKLIRSLQDRLAAMRHGRGANGEDIAGDGSGGPDGAGGNRRGRGGPGGFFGSMAGNPEFQKLMALQMRSRLAQTYGPLFKTLNLSPEQLEQFQGLLAEKQQAVMDVMQAARSQGISPQNDPEGFKQLLTQAESQIDTNIQQTLGDAGFQQYQQYQQTLPERNTVNQLTQQLSYTQTPLTDDQAAQMVQLLAQTQPQKAGNGTSGGANGGLSAFALMNGGGNAQVTSDSLNLAAGVLSGSQVQVLQSIQQQQQAQQQMMQMMRAGRAASSGGAAVTSAAH